MAQFRYLGTVSKPRLHVVWCLTVLFTMITSKAQDINITLTSSLQLSGQSVACPGETVLYICETNGSFLAWIVEPYVPPSSIRIFYTADPPMIFDSIPEAVRVLNATTPHFLSELYLTPRDDLNNTSVICHTNGGVSKSLPYRKSVCCQHPALLSNSIVNVSLESHSIMMAAGSMISYQCRPGFIPEGRMMSVCGDDGRWNPDPENCTEVNCGVLILPVNSSILLGPSDGTRLGSEVIFQCNEGLFPTSEITIACTSEQRWSPDPQLQGIECRDQQAICSLPESPNNVFIEDVTSSTLVFGCNEGYSPQVTLAAVCVATNTWIPDPAQLECVRNSSLTITTNSMTTKDRGTDRDTDTLNPTSPSGATLTPRPRDNQVTLIAAVTSAIVCLLFLGGLITAVLLCLAISRCKINCKPSAKTGQKGPSKVDPVYEDVADLPELAMSGIELRDNEAYGSVKKKRNI